jgi:mRNA-degrading endonuclease toxin of MazEF toxin-antitoxin module
MDVERAVSWLHAGSQGSARAADQWRLSPCRRRTSPACTSESSGSRGLPSHVEIDPNGSGLDEVSYANCEDVKSVSEQRLMGRLGAVDAAVTFQIARTLRFLLDL